MTDTMQRPKPGKADAPKRDQNRTPGAALGHVLTDLGKNGIFIALIAVVVLFTIPHRRHPAAPAEHLQPHRAERLHPRPRDRHGDGHHRGPHRPLGRVGRRLHRRGVRRLRREHGAALVARDHPVAAGRRPGRRLAGLLDRVRRHPGVHRDAGRHAHLPRARAGGARQRRTSARSRRSTARSATASSRTSSAEYQVDPVTTGGSRSSRSSRWRSPQIRTRRGTPEYGQDVEPVGLVHQQACARLRRRRLFLAYALAVFKGMPITLDPAGGPGAGLRHRDEPHASFGRHIYAIGGNRHAAELSRRQDPARRLLAVRQHGRARRARRPDLHRSPEPRRPEGR